MADIDPELELDIRTLSNTSVWGPFWESMRCNNASKIAITPENSLKASAVLACVRVKAESMASLPLHVYRRLPGGGKEIAEVPLERIINREPNGWQTSFEFVELMVSWMMLYGNAYALQKSGRSGAVTELIPLHPTRITVERLQNGSLRYVYNDPSDDTLKRYRQSQIFHLRWLSSDGVLGYVPSSLSQETIALARAAEIFSGAFFGNGARAGTVLESDNPLKPETMKRLRDTFNEIHQGANNFNKTAVLPHGIHLKEMPTDAAAASQLIETRRFAVEDIARAMRVPPYMIGLLDKSSFGSMEQQARDFMTFSLVPEIKRFAAAATRDLLTQDDLFIDFDTTLFLQGDFASRSAWVRELFHIGVLSVDEVRAAEGLNPLPDGEGDKRFVQTSMALLSAFTDENPTAQANVKHANPDPGQAGTHDENPVESEQPVPGEADDE